MFCYITHFKTIFLAKETKQREIASDVNNFENENQIFEFPGRW